MLHAGDVVVDVVAALRNVLHVLDLRLRPLDELLREGEDAVDVELGVQRGRDRGFILLVREVLDVGRALLDEDRHHVLDEHLKRRVLRPETEVHVRHAGLVEQLHERGADLALGVGAEPHAEFAAVIGKRLRDGFQRRLDAEALLRVVNEVLDPVSAHQHAMRVDAVWRAGDQRAVVLARFDI